MPPKRANETAQDSEMSKKRKMNSNLERKEEDCISSTEQTVDKRECLKLSSWTVAEIEGGEVYYIPQVQRFLTYCISSF